jgi:hypothetical protein
VLLHRWPLCGRRAFSYSCCLVLLCFACPLERRTGTRWMDGMNGLRGTYQCRSAWLVDTVVLTVHLGWALGSRCGIYPTSFGAGKGGCMSSLGVLVICTCLYRDGSTAFVQRAGRLCVVCIGAGVSSKSQGVLRPVCPLLCTVLSCPVLSVLSLLARAFLGVRRLGCGLRGRLLLGWVGRGPEAEGAWWLCVLGAGVVSDERGEGCRPRLQGSRARWTLSRGSVAAFAGARVLRGSPEKWEDRY